MSQVLKRSGGSLELFRVTIAKHHVQFLRRLSSVDRSRLRRRFYPIQIIRSEWRVQWGGVFDGEVVAGSLVDEIEDFLKRTVASCLSGMGMIGNLSFKVQA